MAVVTVPGTSTSFVYTSAQAQALAHQIADALAAAGSNLNTVSITSSPVPPPISGKLNELIIKAGGDYTIPGGSGPGATPNWVVILDSTDPVTIHGSQNTSVFGGSSTATIIDPAAIVLAESAGDAVVTVSGTGDVVAGNSHNDTLTASGNAESIVGGTGTNVLSALGSNDTVFAQGNGDTLFGGSGGSTFLIADTAANERLVGGSGALTVSDAGAGTTMFGGSGALDVTTSGRMASVIGGTGAVSATLAGSGAYVAGGLGALSVTDNGTSDTITASLGFTSVTAATSSSFFQGGAGLFNFIGGAGESTIVGSSGDGTVVGGIGTTTILGGAGGSIEYVNTTTGGLNYGAGLGNQTIDASLSRGADTLFGGFDSTGHNVLIGGAGNDLLTAGTGVGTLVGGGGANQFIFWANVGGPAAQSVVSDFSAIDTAWLGNYGADAAAAAIAGATTAGISTTITLSDNTKITFTGVTDPDALIGHIGSF